MRTDNEVQETYIMAIAVARDATPAIVGLEELTDRCIQVMAVFPIGTLPGLSASHGRDL